MKQETLMELSGALQQLQTVSEKIRKEECERTAPHEFDDILVMAQTAPIRGHILNYTDTYAQTSYLRLLAAAINLTESNKLRMAQLVLIGRIIAALKNSFDIEDLLLESMKFDVYDLGEIRDNLSGEQRYHCMIDLFIMICLEGKPKEAHLRYSAEIASLLNISKDAISSAMIAAKAVLTQQTCDVLKLSSSVRHSLESYFPREIFQALRKAEEAQIAAILSSY